ncbi:hypothetical protein HW555_009263 [Spodoptera exigua]|uniref:Uncharacterized protein n=1 Tax=Spodoptera exigua TaxID=7107 RepID=A0A835GBQ9_SPOEX|nr:hypothetical protein HW555_010162 [Spodoptera exigua]KAF9412133.1 hypothetical protein HW555_009263 [Spodoptera exigua]
MHEFDIDIEEFPKLSDILPTLTKKTSLDYENMPDTMVKNLTIDLDKINIKKFKNKITKIADFMGKNDPVLKASRRQANIKKTDEKKFKKAYTYLVRRKILDLMLQTIYMARHKVKPLEANQYFTNKGTSYRVAFLYQRLKLIHGTMMKRFQDITVTSSLRYTKHTGFFDILFGKGSKDYCLHYRKALADHASIIQLHVLFDNLFKVLGKLHDLNKKIGKRLDE